MSWIRKSIVAVGLVATLATGVAVVPVSQVVAAERYESNRSGFNDEYIFAATRGVNDWDEVHPAWKVTLFPVTIILDTLFLPFAVIAGFVA